MGASTVLLEPLKPLLVLVGGQLTAGVPLVEDPTRATVPLTAVVCSRGELSAEPAGFRRTTTTPTMTTPRTMSAPNNQDSQNPPIPDPFPIVLFISQRVVPSLRLQIST
jgi:hypothetical protein